MAERRGSQHSWLHGGLTWAWSQGLLGLIAHGLAEQVAPSHRVSHTETCLLLVVVIVVDVLGVVVVVALVLEGRLVNYRKKSASHKRRNSYIGYSTHAIKDCN